MSSIHECAPVPDSEISGPPSDIKNGPELREKTLRGL